MTKAPPAVLDPDIERVISLSRLPAYVLAVPRAEVQVISDSALALVGANRAEVIGHPMSDFTDGGLRGGLRTLLDGQISGYETHRTFSRTGLHRRFSVRAIGGADPVAYALVVILDDVSQDPTPWRLTRSDPDLRVFGAVNGRMIVDRITADVEQALGLRAEDVAGTSLFLLIDSEDVAGVLLAMARTVSAHEPILMRVRAIRADLSRVLCRLVLIPMVPAPSCAFALLPILGDQPANGEIAPGMLARLVAEAAGAGISQMRPSRPIAMAQRPSMLTAREDELITRLLAGDRVPAIAEALHLSQGTVRNQLSTLYAKLGVNSQQELIDLLRP